MNKLINDGIFVSKSDIIRSALVEYLDKSHELLPEIEKDEEASE